MTTDRNTDFDKAPAPKIANPWDAPAVRARTRTDSVALKAVEAAIAELPASIQTDEDADKAVTTILAGRGATHGNFLDNGSVSQDLKAYLRDTTRADGTKGWDRLTVVQRESLDMICHKIGRIIGGDADFRDHWDDIAGYAKLSAARCSK